MAKNKKGNYKIEKKKQKKINNLPCTFVDADIFLNAILQEKDERGLKFFSSFKGPNKMIITSTHAIGEVVKRVYRLAQEEARDPKSEYKIEKTIEAFKNILDESNIQIENFDGKTLDLIRRVMEFDSRIQFKDAIHVAIAYQLRCNKFCTFDTGISKQTLREFEMSYVDI
jgi:predicted nucleic acid-binding protein